MRNEFPRPLGTSELATLTALLSVEFDGVDQLRDQVKGAAAVRRCRCGCPTIDLAPRPGAVRAPVGDGLLLLEAGIAGDESAAPGEILLFVRDGYLSCLEYVSYGDSPPMAWPGVSDIVPIGNQRS
ncbi:hypothetical protein [Amycolatopsis sp. GM8]|uniref:hypothetical protein n=1 Tax=Amycolatopsis sp. GM8 TaxID=2896530 RepID=UPI001F3E3568|nr:hypothetical protein [Amycolatopsis sp. GM8]